MHVLESIAGDLVSIRDGELLLTSIARRTRLALDCDMAYLSLNDPAAGITALRASDGVRTSDYAQISMPLGTGVLGLAATGVTTESADYLPDAGKLHVERIDAVVREEGVRAILAAPLRIAGLTIGTLTIANRRPGAFSADQREALGSIAAMTAACVETAQLRDRLRLEREQQTDALRSADERGETDRRATGLSSLLTAVLLGGGGQRELLTAASEHLGVGMRLRDEGDPDGGHTDLAVALHRDTGQVLLVSTGAGRHDLEVLGRVVADSLSVASRYARAIDDLRQQHDAELLDDLLDPQTRHGQDRGPATLRLPGAGPYEVTVVEVAPHPRLRQRIEPLQRAVGASAVVVHRRGRLTVVSRVSRRVPDLIIESLRGTGFVGATVTFDREEQVPGAYDEARRTLGLARTLEREECMVRPEELGLATFAIGSDAATIRRFVEAQIRPLLGTQPRNADLRATALHYLESQGSIAAVGARMGVHGNTVRQRLDRLDRELGASWRHGARSLDVHLALRTHAALADLGAASAPPDQISDV